MFTCAILKLIAALVGLLSALIKLYIYIDKKKQK